MAKDFKARMTVKLAVAGAFHTHFMKPAEEKLRCARPSNRCLTHERQPQLMCRHCCLALSSCIHDSRRQQP